MRYAIFSALYPPHLGGVERFTQNLARGLAERGDEVRVITSALSPEDVGEERDAAGFTVVRLASHSLLDGRLPVVRLVGSVREELENLAGWKAERILVNTRFYPLSLVGAAMGYKEHANTIVLDHGSGYLTLDNPTFDVAIRRYEQIVTRHMERGSVRFAGISAKSAAWLREFDIETDLVVPNAIDAAAFRAEATGRRFRAELGLSEDAPLVVYAGRLTSAKGAGIVLEAARMLPSVAFVLAGEGDLEEEIRAHAPKNLSLLGPLSHGDLSSLLSEASVLALPSVSEGFATVLLEAGAWGVPIVASEVGGADEVLAARSWGAILDRRTPLALAEGVDRVLSWSPGERAARSEALRKHVETACSWDATLAALDEAFARGEG